MPTLPPFSTLQTNYPSKSALPTKELLDAIGGQVRHLRNDANTCALRMSLCLNNSEAPLEHTGGLYTLAGAKPTTSTADHRPPASTARFIIRVRDMKTYLDRVYGAGTLVYDARVDPKKIHLGGRKQVQGIVVFEWLGRPRDFSATGHVDLFRVIDRGETMTPQFTPACEGNCLLAGGVRTDGGLSVGDQTMKTILALFGLLAGGSGIVLVEGGRKVPERDLLRGYAFAACLETAYKGTPFSKDASRVAELYREVGRTTQHAVYEAIDQAAGGLDAAEPAMIDGANLAIMSCLEFYEGRALAKIIAPPGRPSHQ